MSKHLHIVCLNVPYPVDYGGVFDLFYKLPVLQELGVKIHLHCFEYGRGRQTALNKYCQSVDYYPRKSFLKSFGSRFPFIVASRINQQLINNLLQDDYPVLMEGIHCSYLLIDKRFENRTLLTRLHNIESDYYTDLAHNTRQLLKRIHYRTEAKLLADYQKEVAHKGTWLTVTQKDADDFTHKYGCKKAHFLPLFLPPWQVNWQEGSGNYCLYHGDLSVAANSMMAEHLVKNVFTQLNVPFVIAGKNPPGNLADLIAEHSNIKLVSNPADVDMEKLIRNAQVNVLPSFSSTGIKLKLLNALYNGRHCLVNPETIAGTGLEATCVVAPLEHFAQQLTFLYNKPFDSSEASRRSRLLSALFDNHSNGIKLLQFIDAASG